MKTYSRILVETPMRTLVSEWEETNEEKLEELRDAMEDMYGDGADCLILRDRIFVPWDLLIQSILIIETKEEVPMKVV